MEGECKVSMTLYSSRSHCISTIYSSHKSVAVVVVVVVVVVGVARDRRRRGD